MRLTVNERILMNRLEAMGYYEGRAVPNVYWFFPNLDPPERERMDKAWRNLAIRFKLPTAIFGLDKLSVMTLELRKAFHADLDELKQQQTHPR